MPNSIGESDSNRTVDQEESPSRSSLKTLLVENHSQTLSESWLKAAWDFGSRKLRYHLVEHPLVGEMGQSVILIFLALFLLSSGAGILGARYWAARETLAHQEFERARGLNAQGQHEQALRRLRAAFHLEHHNRDYQMALTLTLIQLERYDEARLQLDDILRNDPTSRPEKIPIKIDSSKKRCAEPICGTANPPLTSELAARFLASPLRVF